MLDTVNIARVDKFGEKLRERLRAIGESGEWGGKFTISKPPGSDYYRIKVIVNGQPANKNWLQLNGETYFHPSYSSPKPWKLQARFISSPVFSLWEKKPDYKYGRQPSLEWSLGGQDVWAVSYESLDGALSKNSENDVMDEILADLRASWAYANRRGQTNNSPSTMQPSNRVSVVLSVDRKVWSEFQESYTRLYRSRKNHPKRSSYAQLQDDAIDAALMDYVNKRGK